ncbi:MAG: hypothetical protein ABFR90_08110 [Planctomycetota bacterium]
MAARQANQSNAMMYALVIFIALFIIATVVAVIYYVKSEEFRTQAQDAEDDLQKIVFSSENPAKIVGKPTESKSYLGTMQEIVDTLYSFILGKEPLKDAPATVKFNEISMKITEMNNLVLGSDVNPAYGPDDVALLKTIEELKQKLETARAEAASLDQISQGLKNDLQNAAANAEKGEQNLLAELNKFQVQVDQIRDQFDALKQDMQNATDEQVADLQKKIDEGQADLRAKQQELEQTEEKLDGSDTLLKEALAKLDDIGSKADKEIQVYQPDAQIIRIDPQNSIVYLDAGVKDHVYRGLTFAIYDRNKPPLEDGKGKAEIEVFRVEEKISVARIVKSDNNNPVIEEDIVSNLIWDRKMANHFVVAGEFDFNNDGRIDPDGDQRIIEMIERWGGQVDDAITVDTDFLIIGVKPATLKRPSADELDIDPMAQQRYEKSLQKAQDYKQTLDNAANLSIPVFNQKRFLYLIGYDTLIHKNPML